MADLNAMAVPRKYRELGDFHEYYAGSRTAPYLTIFIGGNHEASNHLHELYYGGWVAPRIYYLGAANVVRFGPLRIAGLSGIWKGYNYRKAHYERLPYGDDDLRSVYHVRELDVRKLLQVRTQVDVCLSHDWPQGVEWKGDWQGLFRFKKHLEADARKKSLGSPAAKYVLDHLCPPHWFSAHLHCKYSALVHAAGKVSEPSKGANAELLPAQAPTAEEPATNTDEIDIDLESVDGVTSKPKPVEPEPAVQETQPTAFGISEDLRARLPDSFKSSAPEQVAPSTDIINTTTRFLALDKCLPNRRFLQMLEISPFGEDQDPAVESVDLGYD